MTRLNPSQTQTSGVVPGWLRLWIVPTVAVVVVMGALASLYLGGTVKSADNLKDFPVAVVNQDQGTQLPDGSDLDVGSQIAQGLNMQVDTDEFDLRNLTLDEAHQQMRDGDLYGAIVLPRDLSASVAGFASSASSTNPVAAPEVTVLTNPRAGSTTVPIVTNLGQTALTSADTALGKQLVAASQQSSGTELSGLATTQLSHPLDIQVQAFDPLPDGTGSGLSAFYYALILILAGFTGSLIASTFIDADLGFVPAEFGPVYRLKRHSALSRTATLSLKWAVMSVVAIVVSSAYIGISAALGMPLDHPWVLWLFGIFVIIAVAVVAQSVSALLGGIGMLVNLFIFIILSLPSAGGTVPLEATPTLFRWLSAFEPMHQIYLGTRSVLYLDATWDSGLGRAVIAAAIALVLGLVVGLVGTRVYDRKGFDRAHDRAID